MKKFVFVYYGSVRHDDISKKDMKKVMAVWMKWFKSFEDKMVDGGNPFNDGAMSVTKDGSEEIAADMWPAKGYTIINAKDMKEATKIASGCPVLKDDPDGTVRVYEAMPM